MEPTLLLPDKVVGISSKITAINYILNELHKHTKQYPMFLIAKTASGKSTVLPAKLYQKIKDNIAVTQPRIANAKSIPNQITKWNKDIILGENIGFLTSVQKKRIKKKGIMFMTLGTLVAQMNSPNFMGRYKYVIIDECHERSLDLDLILFKIKKFLAENWQNSSCPKFILMSATFNTPKYRDYFGGGQIIEVEGRSFPLTISYFPDKSIQQLIEMVHTTKPKGDILIFLAKTSDIEEMRDEMSYLEGCIFASFTSETFRKRGDDYDIIYHLETPLRKIIFATNVAQTGLTLPSINYVIDSSLALKPIYYPDIDLLYLSKLKVAKSDVRQRIGRAGRVRPGFGFLPYSERDFNNLLDEDYPEIVRSDISEIMLDYLIEVYGCNRENAADFHRFDYEKINYELDFLDNPPADSVVRALEKLYILGFIQNGVPTKLGVLANKFQRISMEGRKMILSGVVWGIDLRDLIITAVMVDMSKRIKPVPFTQEWKDYAMDEFLQYLHTFYNSTDRSDQMIDAISVIYDNFKILSNLHIKSTGLKFQEIADFRPYIINFKRCVYEGYKMNVARKTKKGYIMIKNNLPIDIFLSDSKFVIFSEAVKLRKIAKSGLNSSMYYIGIDENYFNL